MIFDLDPPVEKMVPAHLLIAMPPPPPNACHGYVTGTKGS